MFKIDFVQIGKEPFSNELNKKVLREICAEARRTWNRDTDYVFKIKDKEYRKQKENSSKDNNNRKRKALQTNQMLLQLRNNTILIDHL